MADPDFTIEQMVKIFRENRHPQQVGCSSFFLSFKIRGYLFETVVEYNHLREYWSMHLIQRHNGEYSLLEMYFKSREVLIDFKTLIYRSFGVRDVEGIRVSGEGNLLETLFSPTLVKIERTW